MAYCDRCDRYFRHMYALAQHERDSSNHNLCSDCEIDFATPLGLKEHYVQSPHHAYCQYCDRHFGCSHDLIRHYEARHDYCGTCNKVFVNEYRLREHYRQSPRHHYCWDCRRDFQSESNLRAHLNSSTHKPKAFTCPGARCGKSFVSRAALVLHLESDVCPSGATRAMVNDHVRKYDTHNLITDPSRMLTAGDTVQYAASGQAWNGYAYECYLCHTSYASLRALNQHLASPKHQAKIYVCPLESCRIKFTTLSALLQHIESERCGVARFKVVQRTLERLVSARMLTY